MLENHPLFLSVFLCIGGVVVASWEMVPQLNELIQLAPFPVMNGPLPLISPPLFCLSPLSALCSLLAIPIIYTSYTPYSHRTTISVTK
jgi:hypothetical protein